MFMLNPKRQWFDMLYLFGCQHLETFLEDELRTDFLFLVYCGKVCGSFLDPRVPVLPYIQVLLIS